VKDRKKHASAQSAYSAAKCERRRVPREGSRTSAKKLCRLRDQGKMQKKWIKNLHSSEGANAPERELALRGSDGMHEVPSAAVAKIAVHPKGHAAPANDNNPQ